MTKTHDEPALDATLVAELVAVDTPTICNALEHIFGRHLKGTEGFTRRPVVCAHPTLPPMVGYARTATVRGAAPSTRPPAEVKALRNAYYRMVAEGGAHRIVVIEDTDDVPGVGGFWGEVNTAIHKGLGLAGLITNGAIRDLDFVAPGFQMLAGCVNPSHAHVHVTAIGVPVTVFGLSVRPGDLLHADRHGAVIIPPEAVAELPAAIQLDRRKEAPILAAARAPGFTVEKLFAAMGEADDIH
jgi:regulator of RNase E activity RraA